MGTQNEIDDGLTDEERAALEEEEGAAAGDGEGEDPPGDGDDGAGEGEGDGSGDGEGAGEEGAGDDGEGAAAAGSDDDPAVKGLDTSAPILVANAPEDADGKLKEIATQKDELLAKFDDGDITTKEYQAELDALNKQEREIEWGIEKAKLAAEIESQRQANEWKSTVDNFIRENPRYSPEKAPSMYQLLDIEVRRVAGLDEFKNRTDPAAGREILAKAHENIAKDLGFEAKPTKQPAPNKQLPPNLASIPAADQNDTQGGKYAVLDRMAASDPIAYEEALMKLPEAERNAYLAS
jgi:Skp family chaperone for outer membrane proteins